MESKIKAKLELLKDPLVLEILQDYTIHNSSVRKLTKWYEAKEKYPLMSSGWVQRDLLDQIREEQEKL